MMELISKSEEETLSFAEKMGAKLFPGALILLTGNLGAGKTVFVKGLADGLECLDLVKSPSYTIMNIYRGSPPLVHFDLYRLNSSDEFYEIGGDEYMNGEYVCAVEWHSNAKNAMGEDFIEIILDDIGENSRRITIDVKGQKHKEWIRNIHDINA